jgi:hypothetical protein
MRRIILSDVLGQTKKKGGYDRSIVETLQKNLVDWMLYLHHINYFLPLFQFIDLLKLVL